MKTAVDVFKVILKFGVSNITKNELGKELAAVFTENGIDKIEDFIVRGRSEVECVLSRENLKSMNISEEHIDFIIAEIKELLSKIEITGEMFRQCKYDSSNLGDFLWKEYSENKNGYIEYENTIKRTLFDVAEVLIKLKRESEEFEKEVLIHISNTVDDIRAEMREGFNSSYKTQKINIQNNVDNIDIQDEIFQNDKKQDYLKIWNSRMFLDADNDKNPIFLADAFVMPDYETYKSVSRIKLLKNDTLDVMISKFIKCYGTFTMLVAGVPGIGKSSIVAWMANKYRYDNRVIMLRFRDWKRNMLKKSILSAVCNELSCEGEDLNHKILVLDGFDEMTALKNGEELLNTFLCELRAFENFKCIITSRLGYFKDLTCFNNVFILKQFNINKVNIFMKKISGKNLTEKEKIELNLEVLGIPVILYMAIMADIKIGENHTKPELYDRIFAETGGIFDKFKIEGTGYDLGNQILRNIDNIKVYLNFLRTVAFTMFEKDSLELSKEEYIIPKLHFQNKNIKIMEFPIKYLFENTEDKIEFIHKSIYEYFMSEYVFVSLQSIVDNDKPKIASRLGMLFKSNILSFEILEFLKYKISNSKLKNDFQIVNNTFRLMLQEGMTYHTGIPFKNAIDCELNVFMNVLKILQLWEGEVIKLGKEITAYLKYLKYIMCNNLKDDMIDLSGICLKEVDLSGENLSGTNLSGTDLTKADLKKANLKKANLHNAILKEADLRGADLRGADLRGADLKETVFSVGQIQDLEYENRYNLRMVNVYIDTTAEIINYKVYMKRKRQQSMSK